MDKRCEQCRTRKASLFAFRDGKPIYSCTRHASSIKKDLAVDWQRLPEVKNNGAGK